MWPRNGDVLSLPLSPSLGPQMFHPDEQQFDACLPRIAEAVRIRSLYDAQIFARRWAIRDKDPALKALVRRLNRVRSGEHAASAFGELKSALAQRGLLRRTAD